MKDKKLRKRFIRVILISSVILLYGCLILYGGYLGVNYECPYRKYLHWYCPGCGGTRMALALLRFDFYQAFRYNTFVFLTGPLLVVLYIHQSLRYIKLGDLSYWLDKVLIVYAILLITFGVLRNTSEFSWLLPTSL